MIKLGTPAQFGVVRNFLRERFSEEVVSAAMGIANMRGFDERDHGRPIRDPLVRLFFAGAAVNSAELRPALPLDIAQALMEMGILERDGDRLWCTVIVYPAWGLHLISDRFTSPDGKPFEPDREFVYFALTPNTLRYIDSLPDEPCESFLDIGAGCGAAALVQARYAAQSVASDISSRCSLFAEFNRRLNAAENVEVVEGSVYEPVGGRTFARIGCHPPYDVSGAARWTFADGGADGEQVIRATIAGLPDHLAPGGEFVSQFRAAELADRPFEARLREWLGEKHGEFDIAVVEREIVSVQDYAMSGIVLDGCTREEANERLRGMLEAGAEQLAYCQVLMRRRASAGQPLTVRRRLGRRAGYDELRWLLAFGAARPLADWAPLVLRPSPDMKVVVTHRAGVDGLVPQDYRLITDAPFSTDTQCPEWIPLLISECNGARTGREVYARMRERGPVEESQFAAALGYLLSLGVLQPASGSRITISH